MKAITDELILEGTVGADIVFRALPKAAQASFAELRREMRRAVERARS